MRDLQKLHDKLLEISKDFDRFCSEHNIAYYLMGGSALGAIRHNGFIPWDDDFDVFMDAKNYYKFLHIAKNKLDTKKYHLQKEDSSEWPMFFTKLRLNGTTYIEPNTKDSNMHQGIFIDIMCLHNVFQNTLLRRFQYWSALILTSYSLNKRGYQFNKSVLKKLAISIAGLIGSLGVKDTLFKFVQCLNNKPSRLVGHFFGKAAFKKTSFPYEWLGEPRYVPFGETYLPVPEQIELYLTMRYGSKYMEMPSKETLLKYPAHASYFDTKVSYSEYLNRHVD